MTILEVVIASMVLFFALTALFGLAMTSTTLSVSARERAKATAVANSYIEQVRNLPYASVGLIAGDPSGSLEGTRTFVQNGMTVTVNTYVTWVDDPYISGLQNYKRLTVRVTVTDVSGKSHSYVATTYVRERRSAEEESMTPPGIDFTYGSPVDGQIVWGDQYVGAETSATMPDGTISVMRILAGKFIVVDPTEARAEWQFNTANGSGWKTWRTTASFLDTTTMEYVQYFPDGPITLVAESFDTLGQRAFVTRRIWLDNYPPKWPTGAIISKVPTWTDSQVKIAWPKAADGGYGATVYRLRLWQQVMPAWEGDHGWRSVDVTMSAPLGNPSVIPYTKSAIPFGHYYFGVSALSPRGLESTWLYLGPVWARARLAAKVSGTTSTDKKHDLRVTPPTFETSGTITYSWQERINGGAWANCSPAQTTTNTIQYTHSRNDVHEYRCKITFRPTYWGGLYNAYSNVVGQVDKNDDLFAKPPNWDYYTW